tara:strand:- start:673 stop:2142 length:1470 start_codon:yes stop_codon:yes gene_type:complete
MESKFNFSDEEDDNRSFKTSSNKDDSFFKSSIIFFKNILDFKSQTDRDSTISSIKSDISIQGATAWILICSIFVASVGLNANSIPVVIGAMLISPLMGPILGFGLAIAINDIDTLKKSTLNFFVMVFLSVFTAFLFFSFFPLKEESSELLSRTQPDIRDVLIAFFGGLALIIARTKKGTISSVVFGVAIATALMPPLCTVGFGLATGNFDYSRGAMLLFLINTLYIILATYLVIKFLGFPMINYANSRKRAFIAKIITFFSVIMIIPALVKFKEVLDKSNFNSSAKEFLKSEFQDLPNKDFLVDNATINYNSNSEKTYWPWDVGESEIIINTFGMKIFSSQMIEDLKKNVTSNTDLSKTQIYILQDIDSQRIDSEKQILILKRSVDSLSIIEKDREISMLRQELIDLKQKKQVFQTVQSILIEYENLNFNQFFDLSIDYEIKNQNDSIVIFYLKKIKKISQQDFYTSAQKFENWAENNLLYKDFKVILD